MQFKIITISIFVFLLFAHAVYSVSGQSYEKPELVITTGHNKDSYNPISAVVFSQNGELLASAAQDMTIKLWDVKTKLEIRMLQRNLKIENSFGVSAVHSLAFSPDGRILASLESYQGSLQSGKIIRIWDVKTGQQIRLFQKDFNNSSLPKISQNLLAYSPSLINFSPDGKTVVTADHNNTVIIWDLETGNEIRTLAGHKGFISSIASSPNGELMATASEDKTIKLWSVVNGTLLHTFEDNYDYVRSISFNADGTAIASSYGINIWNVETKQKIKILDLYESTESKLVSFSSDGKRFVRVRDGLIKHDVKIWNAETWEELKTFGIKLPVATTAINLTGDILAIGSKQGNVRLLNLITGTETDLIGSVSTVEGNTLSADGKFLAVSLRNGYVDIWDLSKGEKVKTLKVSEKEAYGVLFSSDNKLLATSEGSLGNRNIGIWDLATGQKKTSIKPQVSGNFAFSADNNYLGIYVSKNLGESRLSEVWNLSDDKKESLTKQFVFPKNSSTYLKIENEYLRFSQRYDATDHGFIDIVSVDAKDIHKTKVIASLVSFGEKDWIVVTPEGLFDGTPAAWKRVIWRLDNNTFNYAPVEAFFKEFYYPGLLQEIMAGNSPKPPNKDLSQVDIRQPAVKISEIDSKATNSANSLSANTQTVKVKVEIEDNPNKGRKADFPQSSGANDLRLFRNGSLVKSWKRNVFELNEKDGCKQISAANGSPRKAVCETDVQITADKNEFTAYAFNHENVKSNDATAEIKGADSLKRDGTLYVLAIGVNDYLADGHDLKYAVPDIDEISRELKDKQSIVKQYAETKVIKLANQHAAKKNILLALRRFAGDARGELPDDLPKELNEELSKAVKTKPEDALLIYFAGHGTARCEPNPKTGQINCDRFYLIPHDGFPVKFDSEENRRQLLYAQSVSDEELEEELERVDAGKLLMVIDACNSGQALEAEEKRRGPMNSRGLAQLAFEKGMYVLTASQSQQAALETSKLGHGLLTFALLEGLSKAEKNTNNEVIERRWLDYAVNQVPQLQLEAMKTRNAENQKLPAEQRGTEIYIVGGKDEKDLPPEKRGLQTPRIFYRRELELRPLVVAKPS